MQSTFTRRLRVLTAGSVVLAATATVLVLAGGAFGSAVTGAAFSGGGSGTAMVGGTLYAKQGAALTLTVTTDDDARCVQVTGAHDAQQSSTGVKREWTFSFTAGSGEGLKTVSAKAFKKADCKADADHSNRDATYVLDNSGPTVSGTRSPAPNGAGWNRSDVEITWAASDSGSGLATGPSPATDSVTANTPPNGVTRTATATDRVGNAAVGRATVMLDEDEPVVTGSASPAANANGWHNATVTVSVTCSDALSGIKTCSGQGTKVLSTEGAGQVIPVAAQDNADNHASATVGPFNVDKTPPALTGSVVAGVAGDNGWYTSDVTIGWACHDALSGIGDCPADAKITGEGQELSAAASTSDRAGNEASATGPVVKIDKTAPNTEASSIEAWNTVDVDVTLDPHDGMAGVAATHYRIDGGDARTGTDVAIAAEGTHTLEYWSVDRAGNAEAPKTVTVNIDRTSPTISHVFTPAPNANGWFRGDVSVHFVCDDAGAGIESCGPDRVVATEGADQDAGGTAVDRVGNSAHDPVKVSLDRTPPTIQASVDREPNANRWYGADAMVRFACADELSGVVDCPAAEVIGEGEGLSARASVHDAAGNDATDGVSGINVDKTAPKLAGAPATAPNADGWYRADVVVGWTCSDALSGIDGECPADATVKGEGANLSASASVTDRAGNRTNITVDGIGIDRTPPATTAEVPSPLESGWYAGAIEVTLDGVDGLSGVAATHYRVDDGAVKTYSGPFELAEKGTHQITFWSVDKAGNIESDEAPANTIAVKIDGIAPTISGSRAPAANGFGWNNVPVTVSFECEDAESGIAGCTGPITLVNEGAGQQVIGNARDNAGNAADTTVSGINIDTTPPAVSGAATTSPNAAGWYRNDVEVHWTATDGLSGVDESSVPADTVVAGEGSDLGAGPVEVSDKAGNAASAAVSGIKIDRHGPVITGAPKTSPNAAGWYRGDVELGFECADHLSGTASCPSDVLVSGNGADRSAIGDAATDRAGNSTPGKTVDGIKIDGLAPQTTVENQCTKVNQWCTGSTATVVLSANDQDGLSGVEDLRYRINGGPEQVVSGAKAVVSVPLSGSGEAKVEFYAVDRAGNAESMNGATLEYDTISPTVTHSLTPAANAEAWNRDDVTVRFSATDDAGGSGVTEGRTTPDVLVDEETDGRVITGEAFDNAGNRGTDAVTVKLDKTAPTVTGAVVAGDLGAGGWYVGPVKVRFVCADARAGVAVCPDDVTLTGVGADQSVTGEAVDRAGNTASATVGGINIDPTAPTVALKGIADGRVYTLGDVPMPSCTAADEGSGPAGCEVTIARGLPNGVGTFAYTATARDRAGNTATVTGTYRVIYRWDGFLQPINDTAHQVGSTSVFKAGSTVPVKFELKRADGGVVQANAAPAWETPAQGGLMTAPVIEFAYGAATDSGATFRVEDRKYQYNWGTPKAGEGFYHRIGVSLDDGQTYFVSLGLR